MRTRYSRMHDISMMKDRSLSKQICSMCPWPIIKDKLQYINKGETMIINLQ
jgi:hypothetical protein